jgi:Uma2 family endonuclease
MRGNLVQAAVRNCDKMVLFLGDDIMGEPIKKENKKLTYKDYLTWPDDERWELIDGVAYDMSPAPSREHQRISGELVRQFANYLHGKTCEVYAAPFDVRLAEKDERDEDIETIVQPDISVICDSSKLDEKGCKGSPTLVIEIVSPHTAQKDVKRKFSLYEKVGVKEYWIIHPDDKTVMIFRLGEDNRYGRPATYIEDEEIKVDILGELVIDLKSVFRSKP